MEWLELVLATATLDGRGDWGEQLGNDGAAHSTSPPACELAYVRVVDCQPVYVALEKPDLVAGPILIAMPPQPLDAVKRGEQACAP